jgi:hypothetical protein
MADDSILSDEELEATEAQLRAGGDLDHGSARRVLDSHHRLSQRLGDLERVARAARAYRTAMNPQEELDTGWALDEAIQATGMSPDPDPS